MMGDCQQVPVSGGTSTDRETPGNNSSHSRHFGKARLCLSPLSSLLAAHPITRLLGAPSPDPGPTSPFQSQWVCRANYSITAPHPQGGAHHLSCPSVGLRALGTRNAKIRSEKAINSMAIFPPESPTPICLAEAEGRREPAKSASYLD